MEIPQNSAVIYQRIGERMQQARHEAYDGNGLTQQEVAGLLGVSPITLSRWENCVRHPSFEDLERFAQVVNKPLSFFFEDEPQEDDYSRALLRIVDKLEDTEKQDILEYIKWRYEQWFKKLGREE